MLRNKLFFGIIFIVAVLFLISMLETYGIMISFDTLKEARMEIRYELMDNPIQGAIIYSLVYIAAIALSLPVAAALTVLSGFLFGGVAGTAIVVFSATTGATLIFILARFFFRDYFTRKLGSKLEVVDREMRDHGVRDIFLLRLMPIVPFSLINVAAALTSVRLKHYVIATFFGIIPFTYIYVKAGERLSEIGSLQDVVSLQTLIVVSLVVFAAVLPMFIHRRWKKNDRDVENAES